MGMESLSAISGMRTLGIWLNFILAFVALTIAVYFVISA
jgi:hypothetical protein